MNHKIEYVEHVDSEDRVKFVMLEIDNMRFRMDKGDIWNLYCISKTVFDRMKDSCTCLERKIVPSHKGKEPILTKIRGVKTPVVRAFLL